MHENERLDLMGRVLPAGFVMPTEEQVDAAVAGIIAERNPPSPSPVLSQPEFKKLRERFGITDEGDQHVNAA
jgi:hypothetical protein